jgi:hypothetical protein
VASERQEDVVDLCKRAMLSYSVLLGKLPGDIPTLLDQIQWVLGVLHDGPECAPGGEILPSARAVIQRE